MSAINSHIVNTSILLRVFLTESVTANTVATTTSILPTIYASGISIAYGIFRAPMGMRFYYIEDELVCGYFDFTTNEFKLIGDHRGLHNTAVVSHPSGSAIRLATISDLCGVRIFATRAGKSYDNELPGVVINRMGGQRSEDNPAVVDRFSMHCYGGLNNRNERGTDLADMVFAALQDRCAEADNSETNFGKLINIELESGQPLIFDATRPEWPGVLCFGNINAV